jgi:drug/metabolite transporter (DMT)-like permease
MFTYVPLFSEESLGLSPVQAGATVSVMGIVGVIGTVMAFLMFFYLISRFGATATAMVPYIVPVVATLGGVLLLDETLTWGTIIGMLIIGLGIAILNSQAGKSRIRGFLWRQ